VAGPRITVTCDCGEQRQLAYGESYACDCGRTWSTAQIPAEEYDQLGALVRRYRMYGWIVGVAFALVLLLFLLTRPLVLLIVIPTVLMLWVAYLRPLVRRRYRRSMAALSRSWELRPEGPR
jgi:Flp pilus assembly protein TadB